MDQSFIQRYGAVTRPKPPIWETALMPRSAARRANPMGVGERMKMMPPPAIQPQAPAEPAQSQQIGMPVKAGGTGERKIAWPKDKINESESRLREIHKWKYIVDQAGTKCSQLARQFVQAEDEAEKEAIIQDSFYNTAWRTLRGHAGAMFLWFRWADGSSLARFPITEPQVYKYLKS